MSNNKLFQNKRAQLDDALSLIVMLVVIAIVLTGFILVTMTMAKTKYIFNSNSEVKTNLDKESTILSVKNYIAFQKEIKYPTKISEEEK